jgi:putative resolvase
MIKLSKLAKDLGVTKVTLYNWKNEGKIQFIKQGNGNMNFVTVETYNKLLGIKNYKDEKVIIYCRISSSENIINLDIQKDRLISYCNAKGYKVHKIITEIGSAVDDERPKLIKLLFDNEYTRIVVEHKDVLTSFGFNYFNTFTKVLNKEIEVVNNISSTKEDILSDLSNIISLYYFKLNDIKIPKTKLNNIINELNTI